MPQCTPQEMCPEENPCPLFLPSSSSSFVYSFVGRRISIWLSTFSCKNSAEEQLQILLSSRSSSSSNKLWRHTDRRPSLICVAVSGWWWMRCPYSIVPCGMWIECTITLAAIPIPGYPKSQSPLLLLLLVLHQPPIYLLLSPISSSVKCRLPEGGMGRGIAWGGGGIHR